MFLNSSLDNLSTEYLGLVNTLKGLKTPKPVIYIPNNGNWGDSLIRAGTLQFLRVNRFKFQTFLRKQLKHEIRKGFDFSSYVLLIGGGGSWCHNGSRAREFVSEVAAYFSSVVILPTTYELPSLPGHKHIIYFSRDKFESMINIPGSIFCHDMAFYLSEPFPALSFKVSQNGPRDYFRLDREQHSQAQYGSCNQDISSKGNYLTPIPLFLREVRAASYVSTDRLHVAIAACLLGIPCDLYPGNYFKNRAIYLSSIHGYYPAARIFEWPNTTRIA